MSASYATLRWYGVCVFNDANWSSTRMEDTLDLSDLLDAEELAGRRDLYRWMGAQFHLIARRC